MEKINATKIQESKRRRRSVFEDFIYNKDTISEGKIRWRCADRKCKGFSLTSNDIMMLESGRHSHEKEPLKAKRLETLYKLKDRALERFESPIDIVSSEISNVPRICLLICRN